jgi:hypothetical protein
VAQAVSPFRGRLRKSDVAFLQVFLEESLDSDPTLRELKDRLLAALNKRPRRT